MRWIPDATGAKWLAERLDSDYATMHCVVPRGFEAYARVFHPASIGEESVTWGVTADSFGTTMHPLAQWHRIVRSSLEDAHSRLAPDGRQFDAPQTGHLSPEALGGVATHLAAHTTTADEGFVALWSGYGGFVSREYGSRPLLHLPGRDYVLFSAAPRAFADPAWVLDSPWRDRSSEAHGFPPSAQHPNIIWPADQAWAMVSEIDFDSTVVAGSAELVEAICADATLEAHAIAEGSSLGWLADEVNQ